MSKQQTIAEYLTRDNEMKLHTEDHRRKCIDKLTSIPNRNPFREYIREHIESIDDDDNDDGDVVVLPVVGS